MAGGRYDLLIFDWDGTLADSEGPIVRSMQAAIADLGLPPRSDRAIAELIGLGLTDGMQTLYPELDTEELIRLLMSYRASFVGKPGDPVAAAREAPLFNGAEQALAELACGGYVLAVATGKPRPGLERSLKHHATLRPLFAATRTADETANKPDPLMLRELLDELRVPVERALMVGDTEYDAAMARAIGMPMIGVTCGVHAPERIRSAGAMALIETVASLPHWLRGER
ncbi:MAG: family hydrolase [Panacagrimonas sp.]|jgi:phosphoglycolate phosphatase|nr:HAD-IA family hydrolase [Panacagrimonas sp.]MCC2657702.1 family hydrolase [Panacagrimonas sp.]